MSQQFVIRYTSLYSDRVVYLGGYGVVHLTRDARRFDLPADAEVARLIYAEGLAAALGINLGEALSRYEVVTVPSAVIEPRGVAS